MAWIESHQELKDHPKTLALCELLEAERPPVVGHLHLLWWWCINYAPDGDISKYTPKQLAAAAEWRGDPQKFYDAMVDSGFIEKHEKTRKIHDWYHYCGALMERRLQRMAAKRPPVASERPPTVPNQTLPNQTHKDMRGELPPRAFDQLWERYPKKKGRIAAEKHFKKSVKTTQDWMDIQNALENYIREIRKNGTEDQYVKNGSTWFYNWRDDVNYKGVVVPKPFVPPAPPRPPEVLPPEPTDEDLKFMHDTRVKALGACRDPGCRYCPKVAAHV